ncbi:LptF/LptG family permease [Campylobacter sp. RM9344]|uniref:LptF/LptG family permease n=1 Tax=Campylobacter californiensis TaxID=1032243 RepID=A0AAW3ZWV3_9BACT|nr:MULTISPECIES: LptF/LptG family permease [unclassified Campylobacter]MBE2985304.1 LptF/LptG family permease [Campylobacter sp. RM6883]MBE2987142.1 LptF/LptG family permease [Campylobacter sp. RM12919]MBE2988820.1 LptF/LptG family permease [Campylobacter sp. RM12920]MBE2995945.1 LptF/LptG family permease [Campylobacter sp. RM6913]MBE3030058.1 LptF/LptG family permease [Campylobacter sp. RM9344]
MNRVNKYLLHNFLGTFASLFSTLFLIMSIVFFIQIARVTSYIEITFGELIKLYLFMLPKVLLFVVPIAFFVSLAMTLFRLSKENESIVIFTLGSSPNSIAKFFLSFAALLSGALMLLALVMIPIAAELNSNFVDYKKTVAKLNLKPNQFGQKFSEWMVYIGTQDSDENGTIYKDIVMYNPKVQDSERIIIADNAKFSNTQSGVELSLNNGKIYDMRDSLYNQSNFKYMKIRTTQSESTSKVGNIKEYWLEAKTNNKRKKDLCTYVLVALFPLATTLFAISFGIVTYRYEKGAVYLGSFGVLFGYFALIMLLASRPITAIPVVFLSFMLSGILLYQTKIARRY